MLEAKDLTKTFGSVTALDQLNLHVRSGEIYCLLGANGAGKTTTLSLFLGFIRPTSGEAIVNGRIVERFPIETKRDLAYIPEVVHLYRHLTGIENLKYFAELAGRRRLTRKVLLEFLTRAGFPVEAADKRLGNYSKGMRQKVGIAIALVKEAKALLLDEPISGLDPAGANDFLRILESVRDQGVAVLMSTHDLFRARAIADRIGIMRAGTLVESLLPAETSLLDLETIYHQSVASSAIS
ncbi:ABC transporter ATP-binding protein [Thalassoroseus pseudoceratinae]|uniref:ABC transporter ATP-binding protein n=1 Tax=Thalassoroseus pseudoceratinae TaxID=2713176 RepID=UPI001422E447|nr:ABC transporter ATP-binding protein [Thalassoroseus pseudoceratinae]